MGYRHHPGRAGSSPSRGSKYDIYGTERRLRCNISLNGAIDVSTSLLGPTTPNDPTNSCNLQWYDHDPDNNGSTGFGYD